MKQFFEEVKESFKVRKIYQARWVWYHTILAVELLIIIFVLLGILVKI
jgi:hypothetical protein|tara:strand:- start:976 stop:1119 length:144 start_codon:yes stop_codon:yes gene_type:complete